MAQETSGDAASVQGLDIKLKWGWSVGSLGTMTMYYLVNTTVLYFMTDYMSITPATAALIILSSRLYDVFTDPAVGILSDRTVSRWGRRRPWLFVGGILSSLSCIFLFAGPPLEGAGLIAYMVIAFIIYFTGYTAFNIPYLSMPAEMTDDYHDRTILMSYRTFFTSISGMIATGLAPALIVFFGGGREGFRSMAFVIAAIVLTAALICFYGTAGARQTRRAKHDMPRSKWLRSIFSNVPFIQLMFIKLFQLFGSGVTFAMMFYLAVHAFGGGEGAVVYFGVPMYAAIGLSIPVWTWLARHLEKNSVFLISTTGKILVISTFVFLDPSEPVWVFIMRTATFGFFTGGMILMGQSMLPDTIEYDYRTTNLRREGVFASLYSFVEKTSAVMVPVSIGTVLTLGGYVEGLEGGTQPASAVTAIYIGAIVLPIAGYAASIPLLIKYSLNRETMSKLRSGSSEGYSGTSSNLSAVQEPQA